MASKKNEIPKSSSTSASAAGSTSDDNFEVTVVDVDEEMSKQEKVQAKSFESVEGDSKSSSSAGGSSASSGDSSSSNSQSGSPQDSKFELNFKGSELLRAQFPKPFEVAEKVVDEWVHDGRFEGLPLGHPLAQYFAAKGLRRAKEIEKKVMESPTTEKIFTQAFTLGLKAQEIINQVSEKMKK